ncbi:uncharacterized protein FIESC28_08884 [Fusarium coffeatum]|uniref:Rhodopsin domain-containing protein n=1 Tax=Fusarium coffeatum TaxID=231269 RepID=A0A366R3C9_9HYPO|nr:uncharacterized protein FIESC28_08884 [Fusarium coffeatum]RBR11657.1 hypothetical protein FIESC28_08884 [Fusarium coffeatum]
MVAAPSGAAVLTVVFTLVGVAAAILVARIYLRVVIQKQKLIAADWLRILAWLSALATASFDIVYAVEGSLNPENNYTLVNWDVSPEKMERVLRVSIARIMPTLGPGTDQVDSDFMGLNDTFLHDILPMQSIPHCCILSIIPALHEEKTNGALGSVYLLRVRIHRLDVPSTISLLPRNKKLGDKGARKGLQRLVAYHDLPNCLGATFYWISCLYVCPALLSRSILAHDYAVFALPFLILHKLNMRPQVKVSVYAIFLLGFIDIAFSLTRFLTIQLTVVGDFRSITAVELWSSLDVYIGLIVAFLPALRPYLRRKGAKYSYADSGRPTGNSTHPARRTVDRGFTEIDETPSLEGDPRPGPWTVSHSPELGATGWSDKKSNSSDVELVSLDVTAAKDREHV